MPINQEKLIQEFREESLEGLAAAQPLALLVAKREASSEDIAELFRIIHTIKGTSAYLALQNIQKLSHNLETLLDALRSNNELQGQKECGELVLESLDALEGLVESPAKSLHDTHLNQRLNKLLSNFSKECPSKAATKADRLIDSFLHIATQQLNMLQAWVSPDGQGKVNQIKASLEALYNAAEYAGLEVISTKVKALKNLASQSDFTTFLSDFKDQILSLKTLIDHLKPAEEKFAAKPERRSIRINQEALDGLINQVSEFTVLCNAIVSAQRRLESALGSAIPEIRAMREIGQHLVHATENLQRQSMQLRMTEVGTVFARCERTIHDLSIKLNKPLRLQSSGGEAQIDKNIVDDLAEVLLHLIRNAADHGIEPAEIRQKSGKDIEGTITIRAIKEAHAISVCITDDGAGIDSDALVQKALKAGIIEHHGAQHLTDREKFDLMFHPGISTSGAVSNVSGRGVGMDVVRAKIKAYGGRVSIASIPQKGTSITLILPTNFSVLDVVLVKVCNESLAIPIRDVCETIKAPAKALKKAMGHTMVAGRDEVMNVMDLKVHLGLPGESSLIKSAEEIVTLLIVNTQHGLRALQVDEILRKESVVIKPIPSGISQSPSVIGATILGDGQVVLILNPQAL